MRGLGARDGWILAAYLFVWLPLQVVHVDRQLDPQPLAWVPIYLRPAPDAEGHPEVVALREEIGTPADAPRAGDRLLAAGEHSLRGKGRLATLQQAYLAAGEDGRIPFRVEREGARLQRWLPLVTVPNPWSHLVLSLALGISGILVVWRGRGRPVARAYGLAAGVYSLHFCSLYGSTPGRTALGLWLVIGTAFVYPPLVLRTALLFPESLAPRARWPWVLPWALSITGFGLYLWIFGAPSLGLHGFQLASACFAVIIAALLAILARNYRRADVRARRQMRWAFYGLFVAMVPSFGLSVASLAEASLRPLYEASLVLYAGIPFFFFLALVRDNLFDIDRLITRTALLFVLLAAFLTAALYLVPDLARAASESSGVGEATVKPVLWAAVASLLLGVGRWLQPILMRWVAPESERFAQGVKLLRAELTTHRDPAALLRAFGERLADSLALDSCTLYARTAAGFEPVTVRGAALPFSFDGDGPLARALSAADGPLRLSSLAGRRAERAWEPAEREALRVLRAEVLVPVRRGATLAAFVCLGEKRSGDIFTSQDLTLLGTLADDVSRELGRYEAGHVVQGGQALSAEIVALYSCFLSYASADERFARRLREDLDQAEVRTWFAPESLRIGERWREALDEGLARADKLLVVLSRASLASAWVGYEVEAGLAREAESPGARSFLFPVRIDDAILAAIDGWPLRVRESVHIGDFRGWEDEQRYGAALARLLRELSPAARLS